MMVNVLLSQYNFNEAWAKDTIKKYVDSSDKVTVIPFAFREEWIGNSTEWQNAYGRCSGKYYKEIVEPFIKFGVSEDNIKWLNYFNDTKEEMKSVIKNSDIVFLTGGLPEMAVQRVIEKELLNGISDKLIIGASAGALMQLKNYYISPDEDYPEFMYAQGLGLVNKDFYIEVHYEDTNIQNDCIKRVLREKTNIVYAIQDNGGILIDNDKVSLFGDVITFSNK